MRCLVKCIAAVIAGSYTCLSAVAAQIDQVIVRQQWPWSTKIKIEYRLSGVTQPVKIDCTFYNANTRLVPQRAMESVCGDLYASESGVGTIVVDPCIAFGTQQKVLADFRVVLELQEVPASLGDIDEVIYKIYDLNDGSCTDLTRGDILSGRYGTYETDFTKLGDGFNTSVQDVLIWTGVTNDLRYATDKLVMRKVSAARAQWMMGSPLTEEGRVAGDILPIDNDKHFNTISETAETQHKVTMNNDYYIGVFEVTQAQYAKIVSGNENKEGNTYITTAWPSYFNDEQCRAARPVESVSYAYLRGELNKGANWPHDGHGVQSWSFIGLLRGLLKDPQDIDLPTEAQWEFACRAGTIGGLNNGKEIINGNWEGDANLELIGRSKRTGAGGGYVAGVTAPVQNADFTGGGTARVGSFLPNAFGLYDMHGNVAEWCLDYYEDFTDAEQVEPQGPPRNNENWKRVAKGGFWGKYARYCRSAFRCSPKNYGTIDSQLGFRLCVTIRK